MFNKLLIANRGEIAVRIARTARRMGIATVAVYSDADAGAAHVEAADEAVRIGPAPARDSYLAIDRVIAAARRTGADALHPGYGFLSENPALAEACAEAGIAFVGPSPAAIRAMGSKSEGKRIMAAAGVPLVPGFHGDAQDLETLRDEAGRIGWPVLVKAASGGGGRGMRVVEAAGGFEAAVAAAKREAKAAFGDDTLLLEKYVQRPRHVEVQVFADSHGNAIHLWERDCSIQRRHQKVVEEAPAPDLPAATRQALGAAAVAAAKAIAYTGAGTVEFLIEPSGAFYFIEMNTRLQVEHPVTECITGLDLVEWQLRIAAGETLPLGQDAIPLRGHSIEVRLCAEDPARNFLPQTGVFKHLRFPPAGPHVRIDSGVRPGDAVGVAYDSMFAKLIVWDEDRPAAVRRLARALDAVELVGVRSNLPFLTAIARHPSFMAADLGTDFIEKHGAALKPRPAAVDARVLAVAALDELLHRREAAMRSLAASGDPWSPWTLAEGFRVNGTASETIRFRAGESEHAVGVTVQAGGWQLVVEGQPVTACAVRDAEGRIAAELDGHRVVATVLRDGDARTLVLPGTTVALMLHDPAAAAAGADIGGGRLTSPMPGKIVRVLVKDGDSVSRGAPLVVLEAMKMEHTIAAPSDGIVERVAFAVGDTVEEGVELVTFKANG